MRPETVLGLTFEEVNAENSLEIAKNKYAEWQKAYDKMEEYYPDKINKITGLRERVSRALKLFTVRKTAKDPGGQGDGRLDELHAKEEAPFDGDFRLGNERDAFFALHFFTIEEQAYIQLGNHHMVSAGKFTGYNTDTCVRKGFIDELYECFDLAVANYALVSTSAMVQEREYYCRRKMKEIGSECYRKVQEALESGHIEDVGVLIIQGSDMGDPDCLTDYGYAIMYHQFGLHGSMDDALDYFRKAAENGSGRGAWALVEQYDNGYWGIEGAEAQKMCELAVKLGEKRAEERLARGFDTRPLGTILEERFENGDADAAWQIYQMLSAKHKHNEAREWLNRGVEAGQPDALVRAAENAASTNYALTVQYLRRAAERGNVKAILWLGELELVAGDDHFYDAALKLEKHGRPDSATEERHSRELGWYMLAAEAGDVGAMVAISKAYLCGYPVELDHGIAFEWAKKAADTGDVVGAYRLGYMYDQGYGVEKSGARAVELYAVAAEAGVMPALLRLHEIYRDGLPDVEPDPKKATRYLFMSGIGRS